MRPSRAFIALNLVCFALLAWLFGGDVVDYVRARTSPVAAFLELPAIGFAVAVLLVALGALGALVWGLKQGKDESFKGYRLLPIALVLALFVDWFVLGEATLPISSSDLSAITLHGLAAELSKASTDASVPTDPNLVGAVVEQLGPPPFLVRGERPERFGFQVRTGCDGPIGDAPGAEAGTILYCVAKDGSVGWLTLVGLPAEEKFGAPQVFSRGGDVQVTTVIRPGDFASMQELELPPEALEGLAEGDAGQPGGLGDGGLAEERER